jgi:hypothetical protein
MAGFTVFREKLICHIREYTIAHLYGKEKTMPAMCNSLCMDNKY